MDKRDSTTIKVLLIFNLLALVVIFFLGSKKIDQQHNDLFSQVFQLHGRLSEVEAQLESAIGLLEGDTVVELVHSDYEIKNLNFTDRIAEININATLSAAPREAEVYLSYVEVDPESGANIESSRIDIQMEGSEELLYVIDLVVDMDRIYHFDFIAIDENGDTSDISHYESAIDIRNYLSMMRYYSSRITTFQEEEGVEFTLYYSVDHAGYDELNLEQAELTLILDNETFANLDVTSSITAIPSYLFSEGVLRENCL